MFIESTPTFTQFRNDLLPVYPDGNLEVAYSTLTNVVLDGDKKTPSGEPLTWSYILKKFKDHQDWWMHNWGSKEGKWLRDKDRDKRLDIYDFLSQSAWMKEFTIKKGSPERDRYLFGNVPIENLKIQLDNFRSEK